MLQEEIFRRRRGRWHVCGGLWRLLPGVLILITALSCTGCATGRKVRMEETGTEMAMTATDTASSVTKVIRLETVPMSRAEVAIPVESLMKLPAEAVYSERSGQATATVERKGNVIYVSATCDSLARELEYYEEQYYRARDALERHEEHTETDQKEQYESIWNPLGVLIMGLLGGVLLTITVIINRKDGEKGN